MKNLSTHSIPIQDIRPCEYNPRTWDKTMERQLRQSIERFGLVDPIIVNNHPDRKGIIVGGHFRWHIAKQLGITEVPVVYVHLDLEKEKELNLRLNRNTGDWDLELLKEFDIELLLDVGFSDSDLTDIWDDVLQIEDDEFDTQKALEGITTPQASVGDLYQLGNHRLLCGDYTDPATLRKLMGESKVSIIYTDPPYNIALDYHKGVGGKSAYGGKKTKDNKSPEEFREFLKSTMENVLALAEPDLHVFYWCDENYIGLLQGLYTELGITNRRVCLWVKNNQNTTPQIAFNKAYEPCVYGTVGTPYLNKDHAKYNEILNKEVDTGNRAMDDILDLFNIWLAERLPTTEYRHPTEKPVTLHERPLRRCSKPGDIIVDLFGGSGSTLIACEQMKRTCYMVEIEPIFVDIIIQRYEQLTGQKAKKLN